MKRLSAILCAVLAACGGGGTFEGTVRITPPQRAVPLVTAYGDSTQRGPTPGVGPVYTAQAILGGAAVLTQAGVGGASAAHLNADNVSASEANIVTFRFGINDTGTTSPADFHRIMGRLITTAQAGGRRVVVETPNPVWIEPHRTLQPPLVGVLRTLAADLGTVLCDHYAIAFEKGIAHETSDGVHPNEAAIAVQGETLAGCIRQAINK